MERGTDGQSYHKQLINQRCQKTNSKHQQNPDFDCLPTMSASNFKEQPLKGKNRVWNSERNFQGKPQKHQSPNRRCGGDADRFSYDHKWNELLSSEFQRPSNAGNNNNFLPKELPKASASAMPTNANSYNDNYLTTSVAVDGCDNNRWLGGDADRVSRDPHQSIESYRQDYIGDNYWSTKERYFNTKASALAMPTNANSYNITPVAVNELANHRYRHEIDSNLGGFGNDCEESVRSQKSSKTVISRKSAHNLRKTVVSQCKLHETINDQIKEIQNTELDENVDNNACGFKEQPSTQCPIAPSQCKRCNDCFHPATHSQKDVMTDIDTDTLTISVDDVINSKVINPMVRKLQRMFLNTLKEDMSLMDDLERLPHKVNEVYKAAISKQKD